MLNSNTATLVACPTCQTKTPWSKKNPDRPFCSARCKLIDLGAWASESYSIPQQTSEEDEIFSEDLVIDPNKSFL
ncbi:DNA gyrase inhibitor YacG [Marinomonas primoryensis]|uniref:DNA gyrase inhibitor YacG n=1 Tax=Marinomonas primoryensis TaxID=178399 RepID=A0A859D1G0_9GAMM|nr:DNA gyrase inhibitor YacG [Marinomonas primoryensis]QKK80800.1 DNA gyrase inhibitor YacG [Marinomonas primoryensis]